MAEHELPTPPKAPTDDEAREDKVRTLAITGKLKAVLDAEDRALASNDMVAYEALCREEARLMDILRTLFQDGPEGP